ncbi:Rab proteins geranylgeranyltransferase component A 2, partial [Tetrabaena socialis]
MAWTISPDSYDVVVIGSGLPECLVAGSLVKSGKSVLIIDAVDTYGTDFASFTPAALQDVLRRQHDAVGAARAAASAPAPAVGGSDDGAAPRQPHPSHEHSLPECRPLLAPLPPGCQLRRLQQRPLPLYGVRALAVPGEGGGGGGSEADRRGYILDLVPK